MPLPDLAETCERLAKLEQKVDDLKEFGVKETNEMIQRRNQTSTLISIILGIISSTALIIALFHTPIKP